MAQTTSSPTTRSRPTPRGDGTRQQLIHAAIETLKDRGFGGASARTIADRAGVNQGLIFYHFDSVVGLLLAALDAVSSERGIRYQEAVSGASSAAELVDVASSIFREDLETGHIAVLVAMIAGAASTPGLGPEVAERIKPWAGFARRAIGGVLEDSPLGTIVPVDEAAFAVVALYLGLEMLTQLDGDRRPADALFARVRTLTGLFTGLGGSGQTQTAEAGSTEDPEPSDPAGGEVERHP